MTLTFEVPRTLVRDHDDLTVRFVLTDGPATPASTPDATPRAADRPLPLPPASVVRPAILAILAQHNGSMPGHDVTRLLHMQFPNTRLTQNNAATSAAQLRKRGLLRRDDVRGQWTLTDKGQSHATRQ